MKKSVAVLGLGKYGKSLCETLYHHGADVLAVDSNEELINEFSGHCTSAVCANLTNEDEVAALGLKNMDIVVTAMGRNLAASIMSIAVAKEQGVPLVIAKSSSDRMAAILKKVGTRSARILISNSFKDYFELDDNMYMIEMEPKKDWIGKNLIQLELRKKLNLNIVAMKEKGEKWHFVDPGKAFTQDTLLIAVMEKKDLNRWK